jgi:hypothetical protein
VLGVGTCTCGGRLVTEQLSRQLTPPGGRPVDFPQIEEARCESCERRTVAADTVARLTALVAGGPDVPDPVSGPKQVARGGVDAADEVDERGRG